MTTTARAFVITAGKITLTRRRRRRQHAHRVYPKPGGFFKRKIACALFLSPSRHRISSSLSLSLSLLSLSLPRSFPLSFSRVRNVSIIRVRPTGFRPPIYRIFSGGVGGDKSLRHRRTTPYRRFSLERYIYIYI